MRAARVTSLEGPSAVTVDDEVAEPELTAGHVLVAVHEAGVNFPDVLMTKGLYQMRPELPFVPGSECAGVVRAAAKETDSGSAKTMTSGTRTVSAKPPSTGKAATRSPGT